MRDDPKAEPLPLAWLVSLARHLTEDAAGPIDLPELLDSLRVAVEFCPNAKTPGVAKPTSRMYKVILPGTGSPSDLSNRERFSVAHELAHVLLDYQYGVRPTDEVEHREVERWCDHFASELLVPEKAIAKFQAKSWREMYQRMSALADVYQVSLEVVARRIARRTPTLVLARLSESTNRQGERVLRVLWCAGDKEGLKLHRGTHISSNHILSAFLNSLGRASSTKIEVRGRVLRFHAVPRGSKTLLVAANTAHSI